jgi:hypothetical protein
MKTRLILSLIIIFLAAKVFSQTYFRSGIFLHHSTGQYIWGPNPDGNSTTTVPDQMHLFNISHSLTGSDSVSLNEEWWLPGDNEWATQHEFFEGNTAYTDINYYLSNNKILIVKSCFPSSAIDSWGQPSDTTDPTIKSVYNYKWHWRHILSVMKNHPNNFFAIWTNAPLEVNSTNTTQAALAKKFTKWAKDTLAVGLDQLFGAFPHNVYVFDYFNKMTGSNGIELSQYATSSGDSHPNGTATDFIAPQFVNEIFNAALAYEQYLTGIVQLGTENSVVSFPNPVQVDVTFKCKLAQVSTVVLKIFNSNGKEVYLMKKENVMVGEQSYIVDFSNHRRGMYYYTFSINEKIYNGKIVKQ